MGEPVPAGKSSATVTRRDGSYQKVTPDASVEAATLLWLREHGIPAAEVLEFGPDWLLTREVPGRTAAALWPTEERGRVVDALADMTRRLHALPTEDCPFDRALRVTVALAHARAAAGEVDLWDLDDERRSWGTEQLLAALDAQVPTMQAREVPVVTHGDWCLPNVVLDPASIEVVGVIDTSRAGIADSYQDLALMTRSLLSTELNPQYGPAYADRFLNRYGHDPANDDKLAFYRLLDEFF
ncbi:MAG TPA: APH(3') family aminoglycoside O-phosphotransferase [Acidimicrobiales bacterium]|nr:APH(3') family aminoglycoside O-phosphotransferase [Acidimicrobiales bacterium]